MDTGFSSQFSWLVFGVAPNRCVWNLGRPRTTSWHRQEPNSHWSLCARWALGLWEAASAGSTYGTGSRTDDREKNPIYLKMCQNISKSQWYINSPRQFSAFPKNGIEPGGPVLADTNLIFSISSLLSLPVWVFLHHPFLPPRWFISFPQKQTHHYVKIPLIAGSLFFCPVSVLPVSFSPQVWCCSSGTKSFVSPFFKEIFMCELYNLWPEFIRKNIKLCNAICHNIILCRNCLLFVCF